MDHAQQPLPKEQKRRLPESGDAAGTAKRLAGGEWSTYRGIAQVGELCALPAAEQVPTGFPKSLWGPMFHGVAEDPDRTPQQWRRVLLDTFERAATAELSRVGAAYEARRLVEQRVLRFKFNAHLAFCSCPLADAAGDKEVLFDRLCLLWFALRDLTPGKGKPVTRALAALFDL